MNRQMKDLVAWVAALSLAMFAGVGILATGLLIMVFFGVL